MRQLVRVTLRHISLKTFVDDFLVLLLKGWLVWYFNDSSDCVSIISMVWFFHHPLESVLGGRPMQERSKRLSAENCFSQAYPCITNSWGFNKEVERQRGAQEEQFMSLKWEHWVCTSCLSSVWSDISEYVRIQDWQRSSNWRNVKTEKENVQ